MANEKGQQGHPPLAPSGVIKPTSGEEQAAAYESISELKKKKKRMKGFGYIALFAVFQIITILICALMIMSLKTPRVCLGNVTVNNSGHGDIRFTITSEGISVGQFFQETSSDCNSGSDAKLRGKFDLLKDLRRKKPAEMNCSMPIELSSNIGQDLICNASDQ